MPSQGHMRLLSPPLFWVLLLSLSACERSKSVDPQEVRIQISAEPMTLDPSRWEDGHALRILTNTVCSLFETAADGSLKNGSAMDYRWENGYRRLRIRLNPKAKWSDGKAVRPEDVFFGIERALNPKTSGKLAEFLYPIRGARDFHLGKRTHLDSITILNDAIVLELEHPAPYFLKALTLPFTPLRPDSETGISCAPFRIMEKKTAQHILLERNAQYWDESKKPQIERIKIVLIQDESAALHAFQRKQVDVLTRVPVLDYPKLKSQGALTLAPYAATFYLAFNTRSLPANDRALRKKIRHSLHSAELVRVLGTDETPAHYWIPPGFEGYIPRSHSPSTPLNQTAKTSLELGFDSGQKNQLIAERVQRVLKETLGTDISLTRQDWKSYIKRLESDPPQMYRLAWQAPYIDPLPHLQVFTSNNPNNYTGWKNARYDRLIKKIAETPPSKPREQWIIEAQKLLVDEEAVVIPVYHYTQTYAIAPDIEGFSANPLGVVFFRDLKRR